MIPIIAPIESPPPSPSLAISTSLPAAEVVPPSENGAGVGVPPSTGDPPSETRPEGNHGAGYDERVMAMSPCSG